MASRFKSSFSIYRIGIPAFINDKTGEGARLHGGRWTPKRCPVIHFSESLSLCILEISVPLPRRYIKNQLHQMEAVISEKLHYDEVKLKDLKKGWRGFDKYEYCREFGSKWFHSGSSAILKVPSAIIQTEHNFILNPAHDEFKLIRFTRSSPLDVNLKANPNN